jgi:hypothetical protein
MTAGMPEGWLLAADMIGAGSGLRRAAYSVLSGYD